MTLTDTCGLVLLVSLVAPVVAYACAKCAGYAWLKGQWKFLQELRSQREAEDDSDDAKGP